MDCPPRQRRNANNSEIAASVALLSRDSKAHRFPLGATLGKDEIGLRAHTPGGTFQISDAGGALHHFGADAFAREDLE
jgi:hypothetical protein